MRRQGSSPVLTGVQHFIKKMLAALGTPGTQVLGNTLQERHLLVLE